MESSHEIRDLVFRKENLLIENQSLKKNLEKIKKSKGYRLEKALREACREPLAIFRKYIPSLLRKVYRRITKTRKKRDNQVGISVIIPTYKANPYISSAIASVLNQDYDKSLLQIIIAVNNANRKLYEELRMKYSPNKNIKIIYTKRRGPSAARNYAIRYATMPFVTFLDDDDFLTKGFLKGMTPFTRTSDIICGRLVDMDNLGEINTDTYINRTLKRLKNGGTTDEYEKIASIFGSTCAKLYRYDLLANIFRPFDETLPHTEDVVFWAENLRFLNGKIGIVYWKSKEAYVRRVLDISRSRPPKNQMFSFWIVDRIKIIEKLSSQIFINNTSLRAKKIILGQIKAQTNLMLNYFNKLDSTEKKKANNLIRNTSSLFLNKSLFSLESGIAFCQNFSPDSDPSAYVATKRLDELNTLLNCSISWDVLSRSMANCRTQDNLFHLFYSQFRYRNHIKLPAPSYFDELSQFHFGLEAYEITKQLNYDYIYSRSMNAGSHLAAYNYKKTHPESIWIAEFSDPLFKGSDNQKRPIKGVYSGEKIFLNDFWKYIENIVYQNADKIIFTNKNQQEFMLGYLEDRKLIDTITSKSIVMGHPLTDQNLTKIVNSNYDIQKDKINIAFFGSFYRNRTHKDLFTLLKNDKIFLHLFVPNPSDIAEEFPRTRVRVNQYISHLEFLNIASKMDYLFLNDIDFEGEINPYLPSKFADYLSSGTKIIALVNNNSPMSKIHHKNLIKIKKINPSYIKQI